MKPLIVIVLAGTGIVLGPPLLAPVAFELRIVNDGQGVPDLLVTADNGLACRTQRGTGACVWWSQSVMGRAVHFDVRDDTNQFENFGTTLQVSRGRDVILTIHRKP
jgi:hypothetical protein